MLAVQPSTDHFVTEAVEVWNDALGFEAITYSSDGVRWAPLPESYKEEAVGSYAPSINEIQILPGANLGVYVHELGHALGASHEEVKGSVMQKASPYYWRITETTLEQIQDEF